MANQYIGIDHESFSLMGGHALRKEFFEFFGGKTFFLCLVRDLFTEVSEFPKVCISHAVIFLRGDDNRGWPVVLSYDHGFSLSCFHHLPKGLFCFVGGYIFHLIHLK